MCKRFLLLPAIVLLFLIIPEKEASAQYYRHSFGVKVGNYIAADYKAFVSKESALEASVGVLNPFCPQYQFLIFSGAYHYHLKTSVPGLLPYVGAGFSTGARYGGAGEGERNKRTFFLSADMPFGVEYVLRKRPVALSVEWVPKLQLVNNARFLYQCASLGFRYTF